MVLIEAEPTAELYLLPPARSVLSGGDEIYAYLLTIPAPPAINSIPILNN
jgi:hypothetical protein